MSTQHNMVEGMRALVDNRLRTFFMMVGTLIGIAALVVIMAMGKGAEQKVMKKVSVFGERAVMVMVGGPGGPMGQQANITTLSAGDVEAVREQVAGIEAMSPTVMRRDMPIKAGGAQTQTQGMVFAVEPDWHEAWEWYAREGETISAEDMASMARVCVLGSSLANTLFSDENPIGKYIQIGSVRFLVKGVLTSRGTSPMGTDMDNRALIPLTTGLRRLFNQDHLSQIRLKLKDAGQLEQVAAQIRTILRDRHHITPPKEDDFKVVTAAEVAKKVRGVSGTFSWLLTALAGITLLVGGIVLMNILLVSVSERTGEIGLRRALGATQRDIFSQFLAESLAITLLGMLSGSALGWLVTLLVGNFTTMPVMVSWEPFALAGLVSLLVGLIFGIQPARRAAGLEPVQALR